MSGSPGRVVLGSRAGMTAAAPSTWLVRLPNWLGDLVMSSAAVACLGRRFPGTRVEAVAPAHLADLARLIPGLHRVHPLPPAARRLGGLVHFARRLAHQGPFDHYLCLPDSFSTALFGLLVGVPRRTGYRKELRSLLLTRAPAKPRGLHRVEEYCGLVPGADDVPPRVRLRPPAAEVRAGLPWPEAEPRVVFHIHSEAPSRRLPVELGVQIGQLLVDRLGAGLVLTGAAKDAARSAELAANLRRPGRVIDLAGRTDLQALARVAADAELVVSVDSGLAHLGNALGTPVVVLFGAGDEANTAPFERSRLRVVRAAGLPCAPCVDNVCRRYPSARCVEQIPASAVADAAAALLGGR